jgi:uncharacterized protein YjiK
VRPTTRSRGLKRTTSLLGYLFLLVVVTGCDEQGLIAPTAELRQLGSYDVAMPEPSGLSMAGAGVSLYAVSDATNQVYELGLDGTVLATLEYTGVDLEGVAFDASDNTLLVVEERSREIIKLSTSGQELSRHALDVPGAVPNGGLEGIAIRDSDHTLFVVNEKEPALLFRISADFTVASEHDLGAGIDYSGICYDAVTGLMWVVSDQAEVLFTWDPQSGVRDVYDLPINKPEGVAIGPDGRIYVVSDAADRLYVFEVPG